jgi:hypothetical protein
MRTQHLESATNGQPPPKLASTWREATHKKEQQLALRFSDGSASFKERSRENRRQRLSRKRRRTET